MGSLLDVAARGCELLRGDNVTTLGFPAAGSAASRYSWGQVNAGRRLITGTFRLTAQNMLYMLRRSGNNDGFMLDNQLFGVWDVSRELRQI